MKNFLLLTMAFVIALNVSAQVRVTGNVSDERGEALIGATVTEQGTANGTVTDLDGNFAITVKPNAVIHIAFVGYVPATVKTTAAKTNYSIVLK